MNSRGNTETGSSPSDLDGRRALPGYGGEAPLGPQGEKGVLDDIKGKTRTVAGHVDCCKRECKMYTATPGRVIARTVYGYSPRSGITSRDTALSSVSSKTWLAGTLYTGFCGCRSSIQLEMK